MWINWNDLPESMKNEQVRHYYKILKKKQGSLIVKRVFDIVASLVMLILLYKHLLDSDKMFLGGKLIKIGTHSILHVGQQLPQTFGCTQCTF